MSHAATNWAIRQKGLKPATKIVLWHLCDRHHPDNGCFPMQKTLADDCEMSRSTLNLHLDKLEAMGLIRRETSRDEATKQQRPTRYWLALEAENPVSDNRTKVAKAVSEKQQKPCPNFSNSRVRNSDSNSVREPVREPVSKAREALCEILRPETADAFIAHRKAKRAKLTDHAAELIVGKLTGCADPDAAVLESIANGWTGVFPRETKSTGGENGKPDRLSAMLRGAASPPLDRGAGCYPPQPLLARR